jgi:hypothetical protein
MGKHIQFLKKKTEMDEFDISIINAVWDKAENEFGFVFFKRDRFGDIIAKHHFGEQTQYGWTIEMVTPESIGGTRNIENLLPIHWKNVSKNGGGDEPIMNA